MTCSQGIQKLYREGFSRAQAPSNLFDIDHSQKYATHLEIWKRIYMFNERTSSITIFT